MNYYLNRILSAGKNIGLYISSIGILCIFSISTGLLYNCINIKQVIYMIALSISAISAGQVYRRITNI